MDIMGQDSLLKTVELLQKIVELNRSGKSFPEPYEKRLQIATGGSVCGGWDYHQNIPVKIDEEPQYLKKGQRSL